MATYYIAEGDRVTGPYTPRQLVQKWDAGQINVDAQACMSGTEDWMDLGFLIDGLRADFERLNKAPEPARLTATRGKKVTSKGESLFCFGVLLLCFGWLISPIASFVGVVFALVGLCTWKRLIACSHCAGAVPKDFPICSHCGAYFKDR